MSGRILHAIADALHNLPRDGMQARRLCDAANHAVRALADDMEQCPSEYGTLGADIDLAYLAHCEARAATPGPDAEFWRRLAGSVRKAGTLD